MIDTTDDVAPLIAPDILLPAQLPAAGARVPRLMAEYQLVVAVLEDAVQCFQKYVRPKSRRQRRLFREAEAWIMCAQRRPNRRTMDDLQGFSFEFICDTLGLDANDIRMRLRRWQDGQRDCPHDRVNQAA
ncbi:MAG: hypothetical protein U0587_16645 [Candidatus Binatia bacterium]